MDTTTIELSTENWQWLNARKLPGYSFDDVITQLRADLEGDVQPPTTDSLPDSLDLPGSDDVLDERRAAIADCYSHLREHGTASKSDFLELVDADAVGYTSRESFWSNCVKGRDSLRALPGVQPPGEGEHTWRHVP